MHVILTNRKEMAQVFKAQKNNKYELILFSKQRTSIRELLSVNGHNL